MSHFKAIICFRESECLSHEAASPQQDHEEAAEVCCLKDVQMEDRVSLGPHWGTWLAMSGLQASWGRLHIQPGRRLVVFKSSTVLSVSGVPSIITGESFDDDVELNLIGSIPLPVT